MTFRSEAERLKSITCQKCHGKLEPSGRCPDCEYKCKPHPRYQALRKPSGGCVECWRIFALQISAERRLRRQLENAVRRLFTERGR